MSSENATDSFVDVAMEDIEGYSTKRVEAKKKVEPKENPTTTAALELTVMPRRDVIGIGNPDVKSIQVCSTIATSSNLIKDEDQRAPVDIAVALDVSGSMHGDKLSLCKATLDLLIRELRPCDRFGLVTFADDARLEIPTRKLTPESKRAALDRVKRLGTRGCTNLSGGISLAIQDMKAVESPNEVRAIFLLTDGMANRGIRDRSGIVDLTKGCLRSESSHPISISAFGYGSDHDAKLLGNISQITESGSYYFVETDSNVASAFGDCLGGILSVVAQNVVLAINIPPKASMLGVKVVKVHHDRASFNPDGSYTVLLGDFYAEESRDVMFEVTCASASNDTAPIPHAKCSISYADVIQKCIIDKSDPAIALITRPSGVEVSESNPHVATQWLRIRAATAMKQADLLSQAGQLEAARNEIKECLEEIRQETTKGVCANPLTIQIVKDLNESLQGLADRHTWKASGEMRMQNMMLSHARQRCYESSAAVQTNHYAGASKKKRASKFSALLDGQKK